jgi:hypothetical protein
MNSSADQNASHHLELTPSSTRAARQPGWWVLQSLARIFGAVALLAVASFCVFGFLASFEPPTWFEFQVGYAALGCGCLMGAAALWGPRAARTLATVVPLAVAMFSVLGFMVSCRTLGWRWELSYGALACVCLAGSVSDLWRRNGSRGLAIRAPVYLALFALFEAFSGKFFICCLVPLLNRVARLFR